MRKVLLLLAGLLTFGRALAADPVVESITSSTDTSPADATIDFTLDNSDSADDLLVAVVCSHPENGPSTPPTGWTEFDDTSATNTQSAWLGWKKADGIEGASATLTMSSTPDVWAAQVYRISNWDTGQNPEDNNFTNAAPASTTSTPDPSSITQSWGADDNLFITFICHTDDAATVSSYPSGWTTGADTTADGGANESAQASSAYLFDNSSTTVDPGAWTLSEAEVVHEVSVAVLGGAGASSIVPHAQHYYQRVYE